MERRKKGNGRSPSGCTWGKCAFFYMKPRRIWKMRISAEIDADCVIWYFICHALGFDRIAPKENWKFRTEARRSLNITMVSSCFSCEELTSKTLLTWNSHIQLKQNEIKRTNVQIRMSRIAMKQKRQTGNNIINVSLHVEKYLNPVRAT